MKKILLIAAYLLCVCIFLPYRCDASVVRMWPATALTGGASGALDQIVSSRLTDGDMAIAIVSEATHFYSYDSSSVAAEDSPSVIIPDNAPASGRWILSEVKGNVQGIAGNDPYVGLLELNGTSWYIGINDASNLIEWRTSSAVGTNVRMSLSEAGALDLVSDLTTDGDVFAWGDVTAGDDLFVGDDLDVAGIFIISPQTIAYTGDGDITITKSVVLLSGDNDGNAETLDLQDGKTAGQILKIIASANIDDTGPDSVTINMADTTCTNCPAIVFDHIGENAALVWTGTTWVVEALQDAL